MYVKPINIAEIAEQLRSPGRPRGVMLQPFAPCPKCGGTVDMSREGMNRVLFCHSCGTRWRLSDKGVNHVVSSGRQ